MSGHAPGNKLLSSEMRGYSFRPVASQKTVWGCGARSSTQANRVPSMGTTFFTKVWMNHSLTLPSVKVTASHREASMASMSSPPSWLS